MTSQPSQPAQPPIALAPLVLGEHELALIRLALQQDIGSGDVTCEWVFTGEIPGRARLIAKQEGIICGLDLLAAVYREVSPRVLTQLTLQDGALVRRGDELANVSGPVADVLRGERTALNFIQRMSGVASLTRKFRDAVAGTDTAIVDTRKTLPGYRSLDKYAVRIGGGVNHRMGLYDMVLLKDNHVDASGGVTAALARTRAGMRLAGRSLEIAVEVRNPAEFEEASDAAPDYILLDNMTPSQIGSLLSNWKRPAHTRIEVTGNVTLENVRDYALDGVDRISIGALTHSVAAFDVSLLLQR
jgi:nicotinate-nucleotide pyrophosphorylase (carboxylating)